MHFSNIFILCFAALSQASSFENRRLYPHDRIKESRRQAFFDPRERDHPYARRSFLGNFGKPKKDKSSPRGFIDTTSTGGADDSWKRNKGMPCGAKVFGSGIFKPMHSR